MSENGTQDATQPTPEELQAECERLANIAEASQASELDALRELTRYHRAELSQLRGSFRASED